MVASSESALPTFRGQREEAFAAMEETHEEDSVDESHGGGQTVRRDDHLNQAVEDTVGGPGERQAPRPQLPPSTEPNSRAGRQHTRVLRAGEVVDERSGDEKIGDGSRTKPDRDLFARELARVREGET